MNMKHVSIFFIVAAFAAAVLFSPAVWAQELSQESVPLSETVDVFDVQNAGLAEVCAELTARTGMAVTADPQLQRDISLYIKDAPIEDVLKIIADAQGLAYLAKQIPEGAKTFEFVSTEDYQTRYGHAFAQEKISRILTLSYAKPGDAARYLETLKSSEGRMFSYDSRHTLIVLDAPEKVAAMLKIVEKVDVPTEMQTFEFRNVPAEQLLPRVNAFLSEYVGRAEVHQAANRITVTDTPGKLAQIAQLITTVDNDNRMIIVDVKVFEIVLSDEYHKGIDWPAIVSNYKNMKFISKSGGNFTENFSLGTVNAEDFQVLQNSLDAVGIVQQISQETLTVKNGASAGVSIKSVDLVLESADMEDVKRVEQRDAIGFELTASLADQEHVRINLAPAVASYKERIWMDQFYTQAVSHDVSSTDKGAIEVSSGETLVVGGLFKNVIVESTHRIPFLGKIPLLGFAFRNQGQETRKAEMVLFLTPRVSQNEQ